jgi:ferredoxin-type protein NapG
VCPTGALALREGEVPVLGTAVLNREWCLASKGMGCSSCVDACHYEAMSVGADGVPVVDDAACNGCGACEFACISLSAGSLTVGATDKAIVVEPPHEQGSAAS